MLRSIPLSGPARSLLRAAPSASKSIVSGGDDYEILCAIPENRFEAFAQAAKLAGVPVTSIGTVIAGGVGSEVYRRAGAEIALTRLSYSHF